MIDKQPTPTAPDVTAASPHTAPTVGWAPECNRFLKQTGAASMAAIFLVSAAGMQFGSARWGFIYMAAGWWSVSFFALTALLLKDLVIERRPGRAMLWLMAKIVWIVGFIAAVRFGGSGAFPPPIAWAILAGIGTPLFITVLRAVAALPQNFGAPSGSKPPAQRGVAR